MLKKIYRELVLIRTELIAIRKGLQSLRKAMEPVKERKSIKVGIDLCDEGTTDFSPIIASDWEKALARMENVNR